MHGAVALPSLYVDEAGEFKLSGLELVSPLTEADSLLVVRARTPRLSAFGVRQCVDRQEQQGRRWKRGSCPAARRLAAVAAKVPPARGAQGRLERHCPVRTAHGRAAAWLPRSGGLTNRPG